MFDLVYTAASILPQSSHIHYSAHISPKVTSPLLLFISSSNNDWRNSNEKKHTKIVRLHIHGYAFCFSYLCGRLYHTTSHDGVNVMGDSLKIV